MKLKLHLIQYIFDSDLVWRMQLMIIKCQKCRFFFCIAEIFKTNFSNRFFSRKLPFKFVFYRCVFTKVIVYF